MSANYTFNNFRFDRSEKDDGLGGDASLFSKNTKNTTSFMSRMLDLTPTFTIQPQRDTSATTPATIMTAKQTEALTRVTALNLHPAPLPKLDPNKPIVATAMNADQLKTKAQGVLTDIKTVNTIGGGPSGGQQPRQPISFASTVMPAPNASTSVIGQGTFSPVKTASSFTPFTAAASRGNAKADTSVFRTASAPDPQINAGPAGGQSGGNGDLLRKAQTTGMSLTDPDTKGAISGANLMRISENAKAALTSAKLTDRNADLKPGREVLQTLAINNMPFFRPGAIRA